MLLRRNHRHRATPLSLAALALATAALAVAVAAPARAAPAAVDPGPQAEVALASVVKSPGLPAAQSADPQAVSLRLKKVTGGLARPLFVTAAADGVSRLFVVEQAGRIKIVNNGKTRSTPYLSITGRVLDGGEQGLLGLAFSPTFKTDRHFWVSYTKASGALQVSRFTARSATSSKAKSGSEKKVIRIKHPTYTNHNGGMLAFGRDGKLYIATGDGGGSGDPFANGQDRRTLSGKILRINPRKFCGSKHYCIPPSNPYAKPGGARGAIWAYGVRNVWRFSVDKKNGDLWLADVGQDAREEVTRVPYGAKGWNLGWSCREGRTIFKASRCKSGVKYHDPTLNYSHSVGESITGGYVYRGKKYASRLGGLYVFGDFATGDLFVYGKGTRVRVGGVKAYQLASFGETGKGELWAVTLDGGLHRVVASAA